ncbi:unnamed protein product [[Candida] boidinii]|uniref:Unnamed protein product n=1 Tax=Candida boidinii TaxID=5477 RepID=A0ACB5U417_CANBO|nr:unnamed protein product [[Candida] boidinii]
MDDEDTVDAWNNEFTLNSDLSSSNNNLNIERKLSPVNSNESKEINQPIKSLAEDQSRTNEVMNSLWSFVSEVKSNLLQGTELRTVTETKSTSI